MIPVGNLKVFQKINLSVFQSRSGCGILYLIILCSEKERLSCAIINLNLKKE